MPMSSYTAQSIRLAAMRENPAIDLTKLIDFEDWMIIDSKLRGLVSRFSHLVWREYMTFKIFSESFDTGSSSGDAIDMSSIRMMRTGAQLHLILESSETDSLVPMSLDELRTWQPSAEGNKKRIAWAYSGQYIFMNKGTGLTTYGSLVLRYPELPAKIVSGATAIQLPEGVMTETLILQLHKTFTKRYARQDVDTSKEMAQLLNQFYTNYNIQKSEEEIVADVAALT